MKCLKCLSVYFGRQSKFFRIPPKAGFGETLQSKSHSESKAFETCLHKESFLGLHPLHPHSGGHNASTSAGIERMSLLRQLLDADGKSMADVRASIQHLAGTSSLKLPFFRRSWGVQLVGLGTRYETLILWPVSQHTRQTGPISLTAIVDRGQRDSQAASCFGGPFGTFLCQRTFDLR